MDQSPEGRSGFVRRGKAVPAAGGAGRGWGEEKAGEAGEPLPRDVGWSLRLEGDPSIPEEFHAPRPR
jgi:hypothetical protein